MRYATAALEHQPKVKGCGAVRVLRSKSIRPQGAVQGKAAPTHGRAGAGLRPAFLPGPAQISSRLPETAESGGGASARFRDRGRIVDTGSRCGRRFLLARFRNKRPRSPARTAVRGNSRRRRCGPPVRVSGGEWQGMRFRSIPRFAAIRPARRTGMSFRQAKFVRGIGYRTAIDL